MTTEQHSPGFEFERAVRSPEFPVGVYRSNLQGDCVAVNARWCELSGLTEEQSLGKGWRTAIHPEDLDRVVAAEAHALRARQNLRIEFRLRRPDGSSTWVLSQADATYDTDGRLVGFIGTVTDIDARVRAEAALRESEERFRNLVELSPDFIGIHRDGVIQYVNDAGIDMMCAGAPDQIIGHHILEFVLPEHQAVAVERMQSLQRGTPIALAEMEIRRCDGQLIWIETIASLTTWEGERAVQLVARDVTERRKTSEAYRGVVETVRDAMWIMERGGDAEWRCTFVNQAYLRLTNMTLDQVIGLSFEELIAAGTISREAAERSIHRYNETAAERRTHEYDSQVVWNGMLADAITTMTPVIDDAGRCNRIVCLSRDVSRSRQRERALAESEANYRAVVEGTSDAVWVMDKADDNVYRVRLANSRVRELLGLNPGDVIGRRIEEFLPPEEAARTLERYAQVESAGTMLEYEVTVEYPGVRRQLINHLTPLFDGNGRCYRIIGSARDITDRRRAEESLLQAQKLESLGVLAGGIAHDFNNLLTTILGNLFLLEGELPQNSPLHEYANDSKVAAERGADLVRRLLSFSRPGLHASESVSLEELFDETTSLVARTLGPAVRLERVAGSNDDLTRGEFTALQQVLVNLLLNARDAMPHGGVITLSRRRRDIGGDPVWLQRGLVAGAYHEILVADTGSGMTRETTQRIFDPFFTTKDVGKGTGLGLSTALSIVRAHGGWLEAESEFGQGSTFRVLLPAS